MLADTEEPQTASAAGISPLVLILMTADLIVLIFARQPYLSLVVQATLKRTRPLRRKENYSDSAAAPRMASGIRVPISRAAAYLMCRSVSAAVIAASGQRSILPPTWTNIHPFRNAAHIVEHIAEGAFHHADAKPRVTECERWRPKTERDALTGDSQQIFSALFSTRASRRLDSSTRMLSAAISQTAGQNLIRPFVRSPRRLPPVGRFFMYETPGVEMINGERLRSK